MEKASSARREPLTYWVTHVREKAGLFRLGKSVQGPLQGFSQSSCCQAFLHLWSFPEFLLLPLIQTLLQDRVRIQSQAFHACKDQLTQFLLCGLNISAILWAWFIWTSKKEERVLDKDGFIFVSAVDQMIGAREIKNHWLEKRRQFGIAFPAV